MIFFGNFLVLVLIVLQIVQIFCFPHPYGWSDIGGTYPSNKIISNTLRSNQIVNTEPICKKFHFPETEYPLVSTCDIPLNFQEIEKKTCVKTMNTNSYIKSDSKNYINVNYNNDHDMKSVYSRHISEFPALPSLCDSGNFPDIEYPMSASELWKPYYWSCQKNFQSLYSDQPVVSSKLNHTLACKKVTNRLEKLSRHSTTNPVSIKSYSAPQRNFMIDKDNEQEKNVNLQHHNEGKKLIRNKGVRCKTTESQLTPFNKSRNIHPNYHLKMIQSNSITKNKSNNNFEKIDKKPNKLSANEKSNNCLSESNVNVENKLMLDVFKDIAHNIDLNDHKHIERNIVIDSPSTYLKNYGDDSSYLSPIENDITLYANDFNNKMTSITKSVADICLEDTKLPNMKINTDASDPKELYKTDCEETVNYLEKSINTYADRFNDKMSSILSSNFEHNILNDANYMTESFSADKKVIPVNYITDTTADRKTNLLEKNPLHSNICCIIKDEEVCKATDFGSELRNETLTKQKPDKKYVIDDSNKRSDKEISNNIVEIKYDSNEDYTTDVYPETETFYLQSTVAPQISLDTIWKSSQVIEPEKAFGSEELGQYFMLV